MSQRLRKRASCFLLLAFLFNALTPLIAAAQDRVGAHSIVLQLCTSQGFRSVVLDDGGKALPRQIEHSCPFCVHGHAAALPLTLPAAPAYVALLQQSPPASHPAPASSRTAFTLTPPLRGPPVLT